jgi:hypothetical protein
MLHLFREVRVLRQEGKLHKKLIFRVRMLAVIGAVLLGITLFNIVRGADPLTAAALGGIGFVLGLYVFSHMSGVNWNEEEELVQATRMGTVGYVTLALYIAFEIGLRTFLADFFPMSATVFLLAGIAGTLLGRVVGMVVEIHKVFRSTHAS